jgi:hypothetical protein
MTAHLLLRAALTARHMAVLLSLRALPIAVYAVLARATVPHRRVWAASAYLALPIFACALGAGQAIAFVILGSFYYLVVSLGMNQVSNLLRAGRLTRAGAFVVIAFAYLLLPGVVLPGLAIAYFLVVGWELTLSGYSYCAETSRPGARPAPLAECFFFLLVNPTLAYTVRGTAVNPTSGADGWGRPAAGVALIAANVALLVPLGGDLAARGTTAALLACGLVRFVSFYAAHSGLASIQIGLLRRAGWSLPERYEYPLFAASPMDFWRRWNTYVRVWLEAYVFLPIARRAARALPRRFGWVGQVGAVMATLIASGLLHDLYVFAGHQAWGGLKMTRLFVAACVLTGLWHLVTGSSRRVLARFAVRRTPFFDVAARLSGRLALGASIVGAAITWG